MERERDMLVKELCIVEDPSLRKLVIGDAIGSIVMALLNDKTSRKNINTLDNYLSRFERHKRRGDKNDNLRERFDVNRNYLEQMEALRERLQNINRAADDLDPGGAQIREEQMDRINEVTMRIANLQRELDDAGPA
jgi:Zn-dependent oligopeptidase